jgi:hypothetical protein
LLGLCRVCRLCKKNSILYGNILYATLRRTGK